MSLLFFPFFLFFLFSLFFLFLAVFGFVLRLLFTVFMLVFILVLVLKNERSGLWAQSWQHQFNLWCCASISLSRCVLCIGTSEKIQTRTNFDILWGKILHRPDALGLDKKQYIKKFKVLARWSSYLTQTWHPCTKRALMHTDSTSPSTLLQGHMLLLASSFFAVSSLPPTAAHTQGRRRAGLTRQEPGTN